MSMRKMRFEPSLRLESAIPSYGCGLARIGITKKPKEPSSSQGARQEFVAPYATFARDVGKFQGMLRCLGAVGCDELCKSYRSRRGSIFRWAPALGSTRWSLSSGHWPVGAAKSSITVRTLPTFSKGRKPLFVFRIHRVAYGM
jgi:hypothetical protein